MAKIREWDIALYPMFNVFRFHTSDSLPRRGRESQVRQRRPKNPKLLQLWPWPLANNQDEVSQKHLYFHTGRNNLSHQCSRCSLKFLCLHRPWKKRWQKIVIFFSSVWHFAQICLHRFKVIFVVFSDFLLPDVDRSWKVRRDRCSLGECLKRNALEK